MKKYLNTKFYNVTLPILLFVAIMLTGVLAMAFGSNILAGAAIILMVSFKAIHQRLEELSTQQRVDNGLVNKNGVHYPGSLSNASEAEVAEIGKHWSQDTSKGTTLKEVVFGKK